MLLVLQIMLVIAVAAFMFCWEVRYSAGTQWAVSSDVLGTTLVARQLGSRLSQAAIPTHWSLNCARIVCVSAEAGLPEHIKAGLPKDISNRGIRSLEKFIQQLQDKPWVLVDANNVRARFHWRYSPTSVTLAIDRWAKENDLRVLTVWDYGAVASAYMLSNSVVALSGPSQNADEVIVQSVGFLCDNAVIFSADAALYSRCHLVTNETQKRFRLVSKNSVFLLWLLQRFLPPSEMLPEPSTRKDYRRSVDQLVHTLQAEVAIRSSEVASVSRKREEQDRLKLRALTRWLDSPTPRGLSIVGKTKHGKNLLYSHEFTLADSLDLDRRDDIGFEDSIEPLASPLVIPQEPAHPTALIFAAPLGMEYVWVTHTGKRYHLTEACAGGRRGNNASTTRITLEAARAQHFTSCLKCRPETFISHNPTRVSEANG